MAIYKDRQHVSQSTDVAFDIRNKPGAQVKNPGIYRCAGCSDEIVIGCDQKVPERHRQHTSEEGETAWLLLVLAQPRR
ncbi:MAG TPA: hypothetical protein VEK57_20670 [Thermoanaerobaculia bacterium]|nr:hypothetical protein [Thermoanaerobaculia bacterium]